MIVAQRGFAANWARLTRLGDLRCDCRYFARVKVKRVALFTHEIGVKLGDEKVAAAPVRYIHHGVFAGSDFERNGQRPLAKAVYRRPRDAGVGSAHDAALDVGEEDVRVS